MQSTFWSNTIWFILLGISTLIELIIVFIKAKNRKLVLALVCTISGITFIIEATIMVYLKSYEYYPMVLPQLPLDDILAGNIFSQFSITATLLLISVIDLKYYWYFIFAGIYCAIEEFFIKLGIYSQNWYQTWMTFVGVIFLAWMTKKIYKSSIMQIGCILRYIYIFFGLVTLYLISIMWVFKLWGIIDFNIYILSDPMRSYGTLTLFNLLITSVPCIIIYFAKFRWKWMGLITLYIVVYIEYKVNLIYIKEGWFLIFTSIDIWGTYLYVYILDKLYGKTKQRCNNESYI